MPEKAREKPVFVEHAGEIFWLNLNGKGELWLNAKVSKYSGGEKGDSGAHKGRRPRPKKKDGEDDATGSEPAAALPAPSEPVPVQPAPDAPASAEPARDAPPAS